MREKLSAHAHDMWSGWIQYMFSKSTINQDGTMTIPTWAVKRWTRQADTDYSDLPEEEKESDRKEADRLLKIINAPNKPLKNDVRKLTERCRDCKDEFGHTDNCIECPHAPAV